MTGPAIADEAVDFARTKVLHGKHIKKKSVAGDRLRNDTLTGTQVNESKLARVPSAAKADTATSAMNATTLGGLGSAAFVQIGAGAGGDLSGAYPSPRIANGAVTPAKTGTVPAARAVRSASQAVANFTAPNVAFTTESFDTQGLHDNAVTNTRLTAPIAGLYQVSAAVSWEPNATGHRYMAIPLNSASNVAVDQRTAVAGGGYTQQAVSTPLQLSAGDFLEVTVSQSSGGTLDLLAFNANPNLSMVWVGPSS